MTNPNRLAFTGEKDALIFFDAAAGDTAALLVGNKTGRRTIEIEHGAEMQPFIMPGSGVV